jgi:LmbE family N-acetylglucosaminyl deacetylase
MRYFLSFLCVLCALCGNSFSQVRPANDQGALGLGQLLRRLNTTASVMMIGAHPDDEDSALLAFLARGEMARTAYLSLTRGDGGQNIIGPELFESLGVIRTEELLQARRLDGAEQYFTRAFDYGFSKTLAEAKEKWDEKVILCDTVRAIRNFKPMVVIARFTGTPADGHGQHQYSGYIAPLAVKAAADPLACTGAGGPWEVLKFYVEQGFGNNSQPTLRLNTGKYDPLYGRSYFEIAMEGRSQHRSQGEGRLEFRGPVYSGLNLADSKVPKVEKETSIFDGIDISLKQYLPEVSEQTKNALKQYDPNEPQKIIPMLQEADVVVRKELNLFNAAIYYDYVPLPLKDLKTRKAQQDTHLLLAQKHNELDQAIKLAAGIQIDALADKETVVPGENFMATVRVFFPDTANIKIKEITLKNCAGCQFSRAEAPKETNPNAFRRETANETAYFNIGVPGSARPTQPYWLERERSGSFYNWQNDDQQTLSFQPPWISAEVRIEVYGREIVLTQPVQYRFADQTRGEIRRDINIVPALSVALDQKLLIVPYSEKPQTRRVVMSITNNSANTVSGVASLFFSAAAEKDAMIAQTFEVKNKGEKTNIVFNVAIPAKIKPGSYNISGQAAIAGGLVTQEMHVIAYPHIQTHRFYTRAETKMTVLDLKTAPVKVGYIMGSGEEVPEAIKQMGFDLTMLDEKDLSGGDLSRFGTIVVGIRASETRPDLVAHNGRLLDYVKQGGTLIVQYQRPDYAQQKLAPFPTQMGSRVVDENAKVTILDPAHPVFNFPNKIGDADFAGWVQERDLYNFDNFDAAYKPLLESHDEGEKENKGGLVIAEMGKGKYVYCSYAFFRQLPAGVPGAYRLFANLLSLSAK